MKKPIFTYNWLKDQRCLVTIEMSEPLNALSENVSSHSIFKLVH